MEPFWTESTPRCPCRCEPPYFYFEYKVITASGSNSSPYPVDDLVSRCTWDELDWGQRASMNQTTGDPDIDGIPEVTGGSLDYTTSVYAKAETGPPDHITYVSYRRRVRVRVRMRSPANSVGMAYQLRTRQLAADSAGGYALTGETISTGVCGATGVDVTLYEDELGPPPPPNGAPGAVWQSLVGGLGTGGITAGYVGNVVTAAAVKHGFHAYQEVAPTVPVIYREESASGGSPGCVDQGFPERTYDGSQLFIGDEYSSTFSPDVEASGLASGDQAASPHDLPTGGEIVQTATTRTVTSPFICGEEALQDAILLQLTSPISTTTWRNAANLILSQSLTDAAEALADPSSSTSGVVGLDSANRLAQKIVSPGETVYSLSASVLRLSLSGFRAAKADSFDLVVNWQRRSLNRVDGSANVTTLSQTVHCENYGGFDPLGQTFAGGRSALFLVEAPLGFEILAGRVYCADARIITPLVLEAVESE